MPDEQKTQAYKDLATQLRADSIRCTTAAGSGHPTSGMSIADVLSVLAISYLKYDFENPKLPNNDHLLFSKGHACPVLYALYKAVGAISDEELLTLRQFGSKLEGHPTPEIPYVDAATGSLGQGLPIGAGIAIAGKYIDKLPYKVWIVCGDSEMAEGSIYEALEISAHYNLNNLVAIVDVNKLGQRGETALGHDMGAYKARCEAFGWHAIVIDGHNYDEIDAAFSEAMSADKPVAILAKTDKGHGVSFTSGQPGWHGKAMNADQEKQALEELGNPKGDIRIQVQKPEDKKPAELAASADFVAPSYNLGDKYAVRQAYGDALKALGASRGDIFALDAEVSNSTFAETFKKAYPDRFFETYIAEQVMVSLSQGIEARGYTAFCSTFAAFFARAYDQIRMGAVSRASLHLVGSHAGVSIGEDGPSQMALEDLAMFRAVHDSAVLYPSDAVSTIHLVKEMAERSGISYMRTTREKTPVLYSADETFPIGGSKTVRTSDDDKATVIGAGVTLHEAVKAADALKAEGTNVRVIDLYSVKPIDWSTIVAAVQDTQHIIVVEDHWAQGGIGDAVAAVLAEANMPLVKFTHLCVKEMPRSGKPDELLAHYGIDAKAITDAVKAGL